MIVVPPTSTEGLCGFITEANLDEAEAEFPGITRYYLERRPRPKTFLDLVHDFVTGVR